MNDKTVENNQNHTIPDIEIKRLRWILILAGVLFMLGIFMPMLTISKFIIVKNSFSVLSGIIELIRNGHIFLFIVVTAFSIVLPVMKIGVLFKLLSMCDKENIKLKRYLHLMHEYGRWAMLDVLVVAILIVTVKLGAIASIKVHFGLYIFGVSVLLIMLVTNRVVRLTNKLN